MRKTASKAGIEMVERQSKIERLQQGFSTYPSLRPCPHGVLYRNIASDNVQCPICVDLQKEKEKKRKLRLKKRRNELLDAREVQQGIRKRLKKAEEDTIKWTKKANPPKPQMSFALELALGIKKPR